MKNFFLTMTLLLSVVSVFSQSQRVSILESANGQTLLVDGKPFIINGMNWDYVPIGTNYSYNFWAQPDDFIEAALESEMGLLKNMGVNTIRVYTGIQPKWVEYIYKNYGIYTMINHSFGRYGLTLDGAWMSNTEYADPRARKFLIQEAINMTNEFKDTPGLLLFMLGNENNYGLSWGGAATEDIPVETEGTVITRARAMYKVMNEAIVEMKKIDSSHPIAICNGDLLYIDLVAEHVTDLDIYATNMYRGESFGDAFEVVKQKLNKPMMFAEFGSDAFNAISNKEDQKMQAYYMVENWKEIYANASGLGKAGNSLGGFTFQWADGWWKDGQTEDLDIHNTEAIWTSAGYNIDSKDGSKNMNEEWFGVCAKGRPNESGLYDLYPRAAYYALKEVHELDPYKDGLSAANLQSHFENIELMDAVLRARGDKAALGGGDSEKLRISRLSARFTTFNTGGSLITTPDTPDPDSQVFPNQLGFDHMQSYFVGIEGKPASNMRANVNFNIIGKVAENPIDEIFYENRARPIFSLDSNGQQVIENDVNRVNVYDAEFEWNAKDFDLRGFYRTGHYHWGYEGDFFALYPEANYGPNLDIYGGEILGFEVDGKGVAEGVKAAFGPQLWWGANPTALIKYSRKVGQWGVTGIYHRDFETDIELDETGRRVLDQNQVRSGIIPAFPTERATLVLEREIGAFGFTLGGIWAGSPLNGTTYQDVTGSSGNYTVFDDIVSSKDNWGGKGKITYQGGKFNAYVQGGVMGLVANGGADQTQTFTGWKLRDNGSGNQSNFLAGMTYTLGNFQIAPNFLWQQPLVDPMPNDVGAPGRLRNVIDDPFAVRGNRETTAGEILITFDPTPGTWMYEWNNDRAEDAKFAMSAGFVFRHLPTTQDAHIGFQADRTFFAFPNSAPAEDLWEAHTRMVSKLSPNLGIIGNFFYGNGQANGDSERLIKRYGGDVRMIYNKMMVQTHFKFNDWGPFDYHRDFNLTYPVQLMLDVSTSLGKPDWFILPSTVVGIRGTWRTMNEFSPRYSPNVAPPFGAPPISPVGFPDGTEWEIRTYIHINIGN
ncbi:glycosyl hydrolase family 2 [Nonlabens dokdonensis]|uniref:Cellulase domain containing protein n=2 Tax=Nonlabens dokdonensis TaxID=328515 RepID=L7WC36_NONDD|nr:glycoside hydrolase family 2 TIM barrel-domain containing protein [Nonlabens dokdonensis]AGC77481.1 cellulase domain containing protein [Nonlabens dokdonensis DSW-6]PZX39959.1 glycosyl hydrolase family 2 [Nonlabens dokdonensis]